MRRATAAALAALALLVWFAPPASAGDPVKDRQAAQARANAAAAKFARAETQLAKVERELADLQAKTAAAKGHLSELEHQVKQVAVNSYVRGNVGDQLVFDPDLSKTARRNAMVRFANDTDRSAIDEYRAAREDLEVGSASVRKQLEERKSAAASLRKQRQAAYAELTKLQAAEKAYLAKVAAEKEAAAKRAAASKAASAKSSRAAAVVTATPTAGRATGVIATGEWICPVQGPHSFSNDYGQPRSGGRRHEGNDILNPRGTPIVAPVSGTVSFHNSSLGGLSFYLHGSDGNTYFGTHLGSYAQDGPVSAGTVVGYNGDSGNARGTPHLHFEIHPGGGGPVNPYPTLVKYC